MRGTVPPLITSVKVKPAPRSSGTTSTRTSANWPAPPRLLLVAVVDLDLLGQRFAQCRFEHFGLDRNAEDIIEALDDAALMQRALRRQDGLAGACVLGDGHAGIDLEQAGQSAGQARVVAFAGWCNQSSEGRDAGLGPIGKLNRAFAAEKAD